MHDIQAGYITSCTRYPRGVFTPVIIRRNMRSDGIIEITKMHGMAMVDLISFRVW